MPYEVRKTSEFDAWLEGLTDRLAKKAILDRIIRVHAGLLGDRRSVGDKVGELRVDVGKGYRLYFTMHGRAVVQLLCGGTKKSQRSDIRKAEAMAKVLKKKDARDDRVQERQAGYAPAADQPLFTEADLSLSPFDAADYIRDDDETQIYLLRKAFESGHSGYVAHAIGAVARARGLSRLERETGIKRQTLNKSLSLKGNPTLATMMTVLGALGLKLKVVAKRNSSPASLKSE